MIRAALLATALFAAGPARAQADDAIVRDSAGPYQLVPTDGRPACAVELGLSRLDDNARRAVPGACPHVPALARVAAWRLDDGTVLLDAQRKPVMRFVEDETALPSFADLQAPLFYLVPALPGFTHLLQAGEWAGRWKIAQRGKPLCTITLVPRRGASPGDLRPVATAGCPRRSAIARLTGWSLEDLQLMLWGPDDQLLAFAPIGRGRWVAEPGGWSLTK